MTESKPHSRGIANALEAMAHEANLMSAGHPDHAHQYAYRAAFAAEKSKVEAKVRDLEEQLESWQESYRALHRQWNDAHEQHEALARAARDYRTFVLPYLDDEHQVGAAEELDYYLSRVESNPASTPKEDA